jgi:hypothetical protein
MPQNILILADVIPPLGELSMRNLMRFCTSTVGPEKARSMRFQFDEDSMPRARVRTED